MARASGERSVNFKFRVQDADTVVREMRRLGIEGEKQLTRINSAANDSRKGMGKMRGVTQGLGDVADDLTGRLGPLGGAMRGLGPIGVGAAAGLGAFAAALFKARRAVTDVAQIGDLAKRAGADVEAFQELSFAASQYGVETEALTDGLKELALRADEFAQTGKGPAADAYKTLGLSQREVAQNLDDNAKLFDLVIGKIRDLDTEASQLRAFDEVFGGTGGEKLSQVLQGTAADFARLRREARELGIVFDESVVRNAQETERKLSQVQRIVDANLNQAFINLAPTLIQTAELFRDIAIEVNGFVESFKEVENLSERGLERRLSEINRRMKELEQYNSAAALEYTPEYQDLIRDRFDVQSQLQGLRRPAPAADRGGGSGAPAAAGGGMPTPSAKPYREANRAAEDMARARRKAAEAARRQFEANQKIVSSLQFEIEALDKSERQRQIDNALRRLSADATDAQREQVRALAGELYDEKAAQEALNAALEEGNRLQAEGDAIRERVRNAGLSAAEMAYKDRVSKADRLFSAGEISAETRDKERALAKKELDGVNDGLSRMQSLASDAGGALADTFGDVLTGAKDAGDAIDDLERQLLNMATNSLIMQPLQGMFDDLAGNLFNSSGGSGGGGSGGGGWLSGVGNFIAGLFHEGGRVGATGGDSRAVSPLAFAGAPRLHSGTLPGLKPDEVPAILQRGEEVLSRDQAAAARKGGGSEQRPINVTFNVQTPDAGSFRQSQGQMAAQARAALNRASRNL